MTKSKRKRVLTPTGEIMLPALSRPIMIHCCKDGTITYRNVREGEPVFNGVAIPVFSVNTVEEAQAIQVRFCRRQYTEHPDQPGRPWFRLSRLETGTDPAMRGDGLLTLDDLDGVTRMFNQFWAAHYAPIDV